MTADSPTDVRLTDTQRRTLAALCRPVATGGLLATPMSDQEIADQVFLSVDAVEGHLRALYRKFGIEGLAEDQKSARLVELAVAGGYVEASEQDRAAAQERVAASGDDSPPAHVPPAAAVDDDDEPRSLWPYVTLAILILVVIGGTLSISGIFNSGTTNPVRPTPAAYRTEVAGYCEQALADAPTPEGQSRADRARGYLEVIEAVRSKLETLVTPTVPDIALERFGTGLRNAADYTSVVASHLPAAGSAAEAKDVAELHSAAAQIRAGASGYGLGPECLAISELVARSAQNAASP